MVIVVMDYGGNMKGSDKKYIDLDFWNPIFQKMGLLLDRISDFKGPSMSIDDTEYRWVEDRIEYYESEERLLTKQEMDIANLYWKKYGTKR